MVQSLEYKALAFHYQQFKTFDNIPNIDPLKEKTRLCCIYNQTTNELTPCAHLFFLDETVRPLLIAWGRWKESDKLYFLRKDRMDQELQLKYIQDLSFLKIEPF